MPIVEMSERTYAVWRRVAEREGVNVAQVIDRFGFAMEERARKGRERKAGLDRVRRKNRVGWLHSLGWDTATIARIMHLSSDDVRADLRILKVKPVPPSKYSTLVAKDSDKRLKGTK